MILLLPRVTPAMPGLEIAYTWSRCINESVVVPISIAPVVPDHNPPVSSVWKMAGVENVVADQVTKQVVVVGTMQPEHVLIRARQDKPNSKYWSDYHGYYT